MGIIHFIGFTMIAMVVAIGGVLYVKSGELAKEIAAEKESAGDSGQDEPYSEAE